MRSTESTKKTIRLCRIPTFYLFPFDLISAIIRHYEKTVGTFAKYVQKLHEVTEKLFKEKMKSFT